MQVNGTLDRGREYPQAIVGENDQGRALKIDSPFVCEKHGWDVIGSDDRQVAVAP